MLTWCVMLSKKCQRVILQKRGAGYLNGRNKLDARTYRCVQCLQSRCTLLISFRVNSKYLVPSSCLFTHFPGNFIANQSSNQWRFPPPFSISFLWVLCCHLLPERWGLSSISIAITASAFVDDVDGRNCWLSLFKSQRLALHSIDTVAVTASTRWSPIHRLTGRRNSKIWEERMHENKQMTSFSTYSLI